MKFPPGSIKKERPVEKVTSAFFLSAEKEKRRGRGGGGGGEMV
jgi:hypothetical protein